MYKGETPDTFWKTGFVIFKNIVRLEDFEERRVYVKNKDIKHLLVEKTIIEIDISNSWYETRDVGTEKYKRADLSYPVIICESNPRLNLEYEYCILDGNTRVRKTLDRGIKTIRGYFLPYEELEKHMLFWCNTRRCNVSIYEQRKLLGK